MKAILILDEMPKSCGECKLKFSCFGITDEMRTYYRCIIDKCKVDTEGRYYDCPLKTVPEKRVAYGFDQYEDGWNDCIDELLEAINQQVKKWGETDEDA